MGRSSLRRARQVAWSIALLCATLCVPLYAVQADLNDPRVVDAPAIFAANLPEAIGRRSLIVQTTSWMAGSYYYLITLTNTSPWALESLQVLDRYFPDDPSQEVSREWTPYYLDPGQSVSMAFEYPEGPFAKGCHQIELRWGEDWCVILMDCNGINSTGIWSVPLSEEMGAPEKPESLTQDNPSGYSKLGLHVTRNSSPNIMEFVEEMQPSVVVAVGDVGWLADVKEVATDTITLGRFAEDAQQISGDPEQVARDFVNVNAGQYLANPGVDYWLGWNEPGIDGPEEMAWYAAFEAERVRLMADLGLKTAIGNFSTGTPEANEFVEFLPAIEAAKEHDGVLALHEYSAPSMLYGVGAGIPGLEEDEDRGSLTLRYRHWYDEFLQDRDLVIPLVVTEAGIDGGTLRDVDEKLDGWRDFGGELPEELTPIDLSDYIDQLSWYDDELRRDPYVMGFAVFNVGDLDGRWASFDLTDELPELTEMMQDKE